MATSLDEAMETFFEGWTPAPPAADHTPFHSSSYHCYRHHSSPAAHQSPCKVLMSDAQSAHYEEAAAQSHQQQGVTNDWEDWESPFQSRSTSPNMENQDPNDSKRAGSAILAWHSPGRKHCEAETDGLWGATRIQKHKGGVKGTPLSNSKRYLILLQESSFPPCREARRLAGFWKAPMSGLDAPVQLCDQTCHPASCVAQALLPANGAYLPAVLAQQ